MEWLASLDFIYLVYSLSNLRGNLFLAFYARDDINVLYVCGFNYSE
jgi:hypothetical protein